MTPPKGERTSGTWPHGTTWILFRCTPWSLLKYHDKRPFSWQRVVDVSMTPLKVEIPTYPLMLSSDRSVGIMAMIQHCILCLSFRRCLVLQWCLSYLLKDAYNRSCHQMGWWLLTYTTSNQLCYFVVSWDLHHQSFRDSSPRSFFNFFPLLTLKLSILQTPYVFFPPRPAFRHCSQLCSPTPKELALQTTTDSDHFDLAIPRWPLLRPPINPHDSRI